MQVPQKVEAKAAMLACGCSHMPAHLLNGGPKLRFKTKSVA